TARARRRSALVGGRAVLGGRLVGGARQPEPLARALGHQVEVGLRVPADRAVHERTVRVQLQAALADVGEHLANEAPPEALALVRLVDLGVQHGEGPGAHRARPLTLTADGAAVRCQSSIRTSPPSTSTPTATSPPSC